MNTHTLYYFGYFGVLVKLIKGMWTEGSFLRYTYRQCEALRAVTEGMGMGMRQSLI